MLQFSISSRFLYFPVFSQVQSHKEDPLQENRFSMLAFTIFSEAIPCNQCSIGHTFSYT